MSRSRCRNRGFTLIELLVVMALVGILGALLFPALGRARGMAQSAACVSNLRQMQTAYTLYLADHNGQFFRYSEGNLNAPQVLYYYGLSSRGAEGTRKLDKSKAKLAPYFGQIGGVETCPALPYRAPYFKQKYEIASYGYGINVNLLADAPGGYRSISQVTRPAETIAWGDAIQINTIQAPASPDHPMLEEWYWLDLVGYPKFHFRHNGRANVVMMDGSVRSFLPATLNPMCDGLSGCISQQEYFLRVAK